MYEVLVITCSNPAPASRRRPCSITGASSTGASGFGIRYVSGLSRVPSPAARSIALMPGLIPVLVALVRALDRDADVVGLVGGELGQLYPERVEVQARDLLVEVLGQHVDRLLVLLGLAEQLDLGDHLV